MDKIQEFAQSQGYLKAVYMGKWRDYDVYDRVFEPPPGIDEYAVSVSGPPLIILVSGDTIRMSTVDESYEALGKVVLTEEYKERLKKRHWAGRPPKGV
jgi:hypothetical protein